MINSSLGTSDSALTAAATFLLEVVRHRRASEVAEPLFVTCSDSPVGSIFGIDLIRERMLALSCEVSDADRVAIWNAAASNVFFCETLADRICSLRLIPDGGKPVSIHAEEYGELALPRLFRQASPLEPEMTDSPGGITVSANLEAMRMRKVFTLSMAHALAAYLGSGSDRKPLTIADAMRLPEIRSHVVAALEDVAASLARATGESVSSWNEYAGTVLSRISNSRLADPLPRVAQDVPRKISRDDRLVGPLLLVLRTSWKLSEPLLAGVLHALLYAYGYGVTLASFEEDETTHVLGDMLREKGVRHVLTEVSGLRTTDSAERMIIDILESRFVEAIGG